jgi:hypothetical protein
MTPEQIKQKANELKEDDLSMAVLECLDRLVREGLVTPTQDAKRTQPHRWLFLFP